MEMEKLKIEAEVELKKIEAETTSHPWGPKEKSSNPRSPKLPYFDEHTDKMDIYLTRFESYAISNKWDPSMWASYLSALLKGRALEVFVRLSKDDQSDYGQIKEALLTNFDHTKRFFRKKFRDCRPEKAETFRQFSGRLASYLDKWLGLAKVEKTYEAVSDFLAETSSLTVAVMNFICISNLSLLKPWASYLMRRICSPMQRGVFPYVFQKGSIKVRV